MTASRQRQGGGKTASKMAPRSIRAGGFWRGVPLTFRSLKSSGGLQLADFFFLLCVLRRFVMNITSPFKQRAGGKIFCNFLTARFTLVLRTAGNTSSAAISRTFSSSIPAWSRRAWGSRDGNSLASVSKVPHARPVPGPSTKMSSGENKNMHAFSRRYCIQLENTVLGFSCRLPAFLTLAKIRASATSSALP